MLPASQLLLESSWQRRAELQVLLQGRADAKQQSPAPLLSDEQSALTAALPSQPCCAQRRECEDAKVARKNSPVRKRVGKTSPSFQRWGRKGPSSPRSCCSVAGSSVPKHSAAETSCSTAPLLHPCPGTPASLGAAWFLTGKRAWQHAATLPCTSPGRLCHPQHTAHSKCHLQTATAPSCCQLQSHRTAEVGRDLWGSPSPTPCRAGSPQAHCAGWQPGGF